MGVGYKKSGTPDCGRELPGGCPFLAILAKVKGKSFGLLQFQPFIKKCNNITTCIYYNTNNMMLTKHSK